MPRQLKVNACLTFAFAVLFYLFWQSSKHQPALSHVNAFADDPYDAVGSFSTQLALFTAFLSMVRAFRPYQPNRSLEGPIRHLVRAEYITCLSVAITLVSDCVAMLQHPSVWVGVTAGYLLAALVGGMALLTALLGWRIYRSTRASRAPSVQHRWTRAIVISLVGVIVLAFYPENVTHSVPGELLTVLVGVILFFTSVWAWGMAITPTLETAGEDFIDDLAALYRRLKAHSGRFIVLFTTCEKLPGSSWLRPIVNWLNPRKHAWNGIVLLGILIGVAVALAEAIGEGGLGPHIAAIFVGLEGSGILIGYAFLAKPLGLFRHDSNGKRRNEHFIQEG